MKIGLTRFLIAGLLFGIHSINFAQAPGCPNVDAGPDAAVDCTTTCADLTATFLVTGETTRYQVDPIPYAPPYPFTGGTPTSVNVDDIWSSAINLPFDFCFFGNSFNQAIVGSNGVVSFNTLNAGGFCQWSFNQPLPNPTLFTNAIFGPYQDIDPSVGVTADINYAVLGSAPCRTFVINFSTVPMFSAACNNQLQTSQIVIYETTNAIEIYIQDRMAGCAWNNGNALVGIQNDVGTIGYWPPGRNTGDWAATNEAWRFTPADAPNYVFTWYDDMGTNLGNTPTINVCPSNDTTYTAEVVYTSCNGDTVTVTDDVLVTTAAPFNIDLGTDQDWCVGDADVLLDADIGSATATYQWLLNAVPIGGATNPTLTVTSPNSGTYSVTVTDTGCTITEDIIITFHVVPVIDPITDYLLCDDATADGFTQFDLSTKDIEVIGAQVGVTATYHISQGDADAAANPLPALYTNIANPQKIYARLETTANPNCYDTASFDLIVTSGIMANQPPDLRLCDDVANDGVEAFDLTVQTVTVLGGQTGVTVTYHETQADADGDMNPLGSPYSNIANPQTIYVRAEDDINNLCYETTTFQLFVDDLPIANQPPNLDICDDPSNDGTAPFDLDAQTATVLGAQLPVDFNVTYHETQADADANTNALISPYNSIAPYPQTIYIRVENVNNTNCYSTNTFTLTVSAAPSATQPPDLVLCDVNNSGDEIETFDLTVQTAIILGAQLPADFTVTYHESQADADNDLNAIAPANAYNNSINPQTIYVRVENNLDASCYGSTTFNLLVDPKPIIFAPTPLAICDDTIPDGFTQFDLTVKDDEIRGGNATLVVSYYETLADAQAGINALLSPYTNTANPQIIFARVDSLSTGCFDVTTLELQVQPAPIIFLPLPLESCDPDNDGFSEFTLTDADAQITGGNPMLIVSYHETLADAQNNLNPLVSPYTNIVMNMQTLFARVTDINTGCLSFTPLVISMFPNPSPEPNPDDIMVCDDINTGDEQEIVDLTVNEIQILNGEVGVTPTYYETFADAEAGTNAITTPTMYANTTNPQTIYVRVTNDISGCYTIVDFDIIVNPLPAVIAVPDLKECEVNSDGFFDFDLESKTMEILNGQDPMQFAVTYHQTQGDADANANALASPYTNITNPQQIFVSITNTNTGCAISTVNFNIEVLIGSSATPPANEYAICDNIGDNDGFGQFDLSTQDAEILNGQIPADNTVSYHLTQVDADNGVNAIPTTYENISNPQTIYARVDNSASVCYATTSLTLRVNLLPEFNLDDSYGLCIDENGMVINNGNSPPVLDTGLSALDYSFEWTEAAAPASVLGTGSSYTATQAGSYSVLVTNNATGCQNTDTAVVTASSPPIVVATVTTQAFADSHTVEAVATGNGVYEFSIDGGPWFSNDPNDNRYTFTEVSAGEHIITARDINGCGVSSDNVFVIDYPVYFTPNGDGYNDTWNIIGVSRLPNTKIYIFDRYGKLLKQLNPAGAGWTGIYNGEPLPSSDYWFSLDYQDPSDGITKQLRAHFTLKR